MNGAGTEPNPVVTELFPQGEGNRMIADGELPLDLERLTERLAAGARLVEPLWDDEMEFPRIRAKTLAANIFLNWAERIDEISATNILATLVEAAGAKTYAAELLIKVWPHIKDPQQRRDAPFLRYCTLFGRELVERALLGPNAKPLGDGDEQTKASRPGTAFELLAFAAADPARWPNSPASHTTAAARGTRWT